MLRQWIVGLLVGLSLGTAQGQTPEYKRATSVSDFADGAECIITYKKSGGLCNLEITRDTRGGDANIYKLTHSKINVNIEELATRTTTLQLKRVAGHFYLFAPTEGLYVSAVTRSVTTNTALYDLFSLTPTPTDSVYIEKNGSNYEVRLGPKYFRHHQTVSEYRLTGKTSTNTSPILLYVVGEKKPDPILALDANTDLATVNFEGTVRFDRTFANGLYNTLMLPFAIADPWQVFGSGVVIYQPNKANQGTLMLRRLKSGERLQANTPYLLTGTFDKPPYIISKVKINYNANAAASKTTVGALTIQGVYQKRAMGGTGHYVMYRDHFSRCTATPSLAIEPYKWYIADPGTPAKGIRWGRIIRLGK